MRNTSTIRTTLCLAFLLLVARVATAGCTLQGPTEIYYVPGGNNVYSWDFTEDGQGPCNTESWQTWTVTWLSPQFGTENVNADYLLVLDFTGTGSVRITHPNGQTRTIFVHAGAPLAPGQPRLVSEHCGYTKIGWPLNSSPPTGVDWFWYSSTGVFGGASSTLDVDPTDPLTWYLQARDQASLLVGGSSPTYTVTNINLFPSAPTGGSMSTCYGTSINLTATAPGGTTLKWYTTQTGTQVVPGGVTPNLTSATTYWAASVSSAGCESTSRLPVTVNIDPLPVPGGMSPLTPFNLCVGSKIKVAVSGYTGIPEFEVSINGVVETSWTSLTVDNEFHFQPEQFMFEGMSAEVRIRTRSRNGCGAVESGQTLSPFTAWPMPVIVAAGQFPNPLCPGHTVTLSASTPPGLNQNVRWYETEDATTPIAPQGNVEVGPLTTSRTYWVAPFGAGTCEGPKEPFTVTVTPDPPNDGYITASQQTICLGDEVVISYHSDSENGQNGAHGTPHYFASSNGGTSWNIFNDAHIGETSFWHQPPAAGTYTYLVRNKTTCGFCWDPGNTCTEYNTVTVTVLPPPNPGVLTVNHDSHNACLYGELEITVSNSNSRSAVWITVTPLNQPPFDLITESTHDFRTGPLTRFLSDLGEYRVRMRSLSDCNHLGPESEEQTWTFHVWERPGDPTSTTVAQVCEGTTINLTAVKGLNAESVKWYTTAEGGSALSSTHVGPLSPPLAEYWVSSYTSTGGCESAPRVRVPIVVTAFPIDSDVALLGDVNVCVGTTVNLETSGGRGDPYYSVTSNGNSWDVQDVPVIGGAFSYVPQTPGIHKFLVRNKTEGCGFCGDVGVTCAYEKTVSVTVFGKASAGEIWGETAVINGTPYIYSVPGAKNVDTYTWTATNGEIVGGQGMNTISAIFGSGGSTLCVAVSNAICGPGEGACIDITEGLNYIIEEVPRGKTSDVNAILSMDEESKMKTTTFFDGLGRPMQTVEYRGSPDRLDLVVPFRYDEYGRQQLKYLPYQATTGNGGYKYDATIKQAEFYFDNPPGIPHDSKPYSKSIFDHSPLNRIIEQGAPGEDWQPDENHRTVRKEYLLNLAEEVLKFTVINGKISLDPENAHHPEKTLYRNKTIDEQHHVTYEFVNMEGKTICRQVQVDDNEYASTYYVYNNLNQLVAVLQPEAIKNILETLGN